MDIKNFSSTRISRLLAIAILFGMSATSAHAADDSSEKIFVDAENFFGQTIQTSGEIFNNTEIFTSATPSAVGLYVLGSNNRIIQRADIFLSGTRSVGLQVDGAGNLITLARGVTIRSDGLGGKGILIRGRDNRLHVLGFVTAAGNAVEFNGADDTRGNVLNLSGTLQGDNNAIYIGEQSFVRDINIDDGAALFGDIASASKFATDLNFNADLNYSGNIFGDNLRMNINDGTLKFSGRANVSSVEVMSGAKLFGGTFNAGNFVNHGTLGAGSPDTNLIINGNLTSDGFLQKISGGNAGMIIVNGAANVEGSTVTTDSLLPNETATVLVADSISGNIANPVDKPVQISAMLNAAGEIVGNTLTVTTYAADNLGKLSSREAETFGAMKNIFDTLDDDRREEMREFYNLDTSSAKKTLTQIGSNDAAQIMSVAQQSNAVDKMIADRITRVFAPNYIDVNVRPMNFADGDDSSDLTVNVKIPTRQENNFWLNFMKNWGSLRGGTDYHGSAIVGGWDRALGDKWRVGIFATYGTIGYGANSSRATVYDTRLGLYAGRHNRASDIYFYVNGGQLRNSLHRGISSLGLSTNAKYTSRIIEVGGEYKYDLQPARTWHVSPYVNFQASHLKQNAYSESGAGIYNQHVDADSNTYFAAQIGLDLKRYCRTGMIGLRFGVKRGFTGADPDLRISYEGDGSHSYRLRQQRDKTHFVFSLRGENEFARGWFVGGEAELQRGAHDKDLTASLMLRRTW